MPGFALVEVDIRDEESVQRGVQTIIAQPKRINVLVNSAGVTLVGSTEETSTDEAKILFNTNRFGSFSFERSTYPTARTYVCTCFSGLFHRRLIGFLS